MPFIFHIPPWGPMYYFLGAEQFQLLCRVIFGDSAKTGLNWFLLILQTAKPPTKKEIMLMSKIFCYVYFRLTNMTMAASLKVTRRQT